MAHIGLATLAGTARVLTTSVFVRPERGSTPRIGLQERAMPSHVERPAAFGSEDLPSQTRFVAQISWSHRRTLQELHKAIPTPKPRSMLGAPS